MTSTAINSPSRLIPSRWATTKPLGFCATAEHPADHPHHAGIWVAAERVSWWSADGPGEEHTYNFYVDDTFQGRAPGSIVSTRLRLAGQSQDSARIQQTCLWRGPREWGATRGRIVAMERQTITVSVAERYNVIDIECALQSRRGRLRIGPTRHAWFNVRLADAVVTSGPRLVRSRHAQDGVPTWMDLTGSAGDGNRVGISVLHRDADHPTGWFAENWGIITLQPFVRAAREIAPGETLHLAARFVVHDGDIDPQELDQLASTS